MNELQSWHDEVLGNRTVTALRNHGFTAEYMPTGNDAIKYIVDRIPASASVGIGGSRTVKDLKIDQRLLDLGCTVYDHNIKDISVDDRNALRYKQLSADFFITGTNAVTLTGELMNYDCFGNRVGAMIFGPATVFIIAGTNKIAHDLDDAEKRIKTFAAPMNCKKYNLATPCVKLGECVDCSSAERICNIKTVISRRPPLTDIHVLIIGGNWGF